MSVFKNGAVLRLSFICGAAALAACASVETPARQTQDYAPSRYERAVSAPTYVDAGIEASASKLFAELTGENPDRLVLNRSTVARVAISDRADTAVAGHEAGAAAPTSADKAINDLAGGSTGVILNRAQNAMNDTGWVQAEGGYVHLPSGFVCPNNLTIAVDNEEGQRVATVTAPINNIRMFANDGTDTACDYVSQSAGVYLTFFVSKWPDKTLDEHYGAALKHIVDRFPIASEAGVITPEMTIDTSGYESTIEGATRSGAFILEPQDGVVLKTALWLNKTGDWHIKARGTYSVALEGNEIPEFSAAELLGAVFHIATLHSVDKHINTNGAVEVSY